MSLVYTIEVSNSVAEKLLCDLHDADNRDFIQGFYYLSLRSEEDKLAVLETMEIFYDGNFILRVKVNSLKLYNKSNYVDDFNLYQAQLFNTEKYVEIFDL